MDCDHWWSSIGKGLRLQPVQQSCFFFNPINCFFSRCRGPPRSAALSFGPLHHLSILHKFAKTFRQFLPLAQNVPLSLPNLSPCRYFRGSSDISSFVTKRNYKHCVFSVHRRVQCTLQCEVYTIQDCLYSVYCTL